VHQFDNKVLDIERLLALTRILNTMKYCWQCR